MKQVITRSLRRRARLGASEAPRVSRAAQGVSCAEAPRESFDAPESNCICQRKCNVANKRSPEISSKHSKLPSRLSCPRWSPGVSAAAGRGRISRTHAPRRELAPPRSLFRAAETTARVSQDRHAYRLMGYMCVCVCV